MPPSSVFSHNLRKLCEQSISIAQVARDLDISKVQMNRFLKGSSLPKPAVLQRVCDYFGVDARILLEPITDEEAEMLSAPPTSSAAVRRFSNALSASQRAGYEYVLTPTSGKGDLDYLPCGLYLWCRHAFGHAGKALQLPVRVSVHKGAHVLRGYDPLNSSIGSLRASNASRDREFRGLVTRHVVGLSVTFFARDSNDTLCFSYFSRTGHMGPDFYCGYSALTRPHTPGLRRFSPSVLKRLRGQEANPVWLAHNSGVMPMENLSSEIVNELKKPFEV